MYVIDTITEIVEELYKGGEDFAPFAYVGKDVYQTLRKHMIKQSCNPYTSVPGTFTMTIQTPYEAISIKVDLEKPADYIGINGRTLLDIVAERELLGL